MTRRGVFIVAGQALGGVAAVAVLLPVVGFAVAPILETPEEVWTASARPTTSTSTATGPSPSRSVSGIGEAGKTTAYVRKGCRGPGRGSRLVRRDLDPLRPPRLPGPVHRRRRHLQLPLPRRRLRLRGQGDRRPAGPPARPVPDPGRGRRGPDRPPLQRHQRARARPRPRPGRVHGRHLGIPLPAAAVDAAGSVMPPEASSTSPRSRARTAPPPTAQRRRPAVDMLKEGGTDLVGWVDERTGATPFLTGMLFRKVPKGTNWFYTLGSATLFAFVVQAITGRLPRDVLHAVAGRGLRVDHPPHQRRVPRRVRPRHAQVGLERDDHRDLPAHGQGLLLRRLQVPARAQLDHRRRPDRPRPLDGAHRLPAAVRPALLLGDDRRDEHQRHRPDHRPLPGRLPACRRRVRSDDADALLLAAHAADPRRDHRADRRPPLPGRQARHHGTALDPRRHEAEVPAHGEGGELA